MECSAIQTQTSNADKWSKSVRGNHPGESGSRRNEVRYPPVSSRIASIAGCWHNAGDKRRWVVLPPRDHIRWYCQTFKSYCEEAGRRGLGVVVEETDVGPTFLIQCRSIEPKDEQAFKAINTPVPVSLVTQTGMLFCPWCGKNLRRRYGRHAKDLARPDLSTQLP
jgi:hypothetical protein